MVNLRRPLMFAVSGIEINEDVKSPGVCLFLGSFINCEQRQQPFCDPLSRAAFKYSNLRCPFSRALLVPNHEN